MNNTAAVVVFKQALADWSCLTNVRWSLSDIPTQSFNNMDAFSTVRFGTPSNSAYVAETFRPVERCSGGGASEIGRVIGLDIVFDPTPGGNGWPWFYDGTGNLAQPSQMYDFYSVALHELGHANLLAHVNDENDLMYTESLGSLNQAIPPAGRKIHFSQPNSDGGGSVIIESASLNLSSCTYDSNNPNDPEPFNHEPLIIPGCETGLSVDGFGSLDIQIIAIPNPVEDIFNIIIDPNINGYASLQLYDVKGVMLIASKRTIAEGGNLGSIDVSHLHSGLYLVKVALGNQYRTIKIIKK